VIEFGCNTGTHGYSCEARYAQRMPLEVCLTYVLQGGAPDALGIGEGVQLA